MLKPIETSYDGHRFRSRLEARWAVFFNVLGVAYEYEAQGYTFEEYTYLPDFWMSTWEMFVEIKPSRPYGDELKRFIAFAKHAEKSLLIFYGNASADEHRVLWCSPNGYETDNLQLGSCRDGCGQIFIENEMWGAQAIAPLTGHDCFEGLKICRPVIWNKMLDAFNAAQGARFEFGEAWHAGLKRNEANL